MQTNQRWTFFHRQGIWIILSFSSWPSKLLLMSWAADRIKQDIGQIGYWFATPTNSVSPLFQLILQSRHTVGQRFLARFGSTFLFMQPEVTFLQQKRPEHRGKSSMQAPTQPLYVQWFLSSEKKNHKKQQKFQRFYFSFLHNIYYKTLNKFVLSTFCFLKVFFLCTTMLSDIFSFS